MTDGSKPLKNARHELFAQNLAQGMSATEAYAKAGYKPSDQHASRLARNGKVRTRVAFLQGQAAERTVTTIEKITAELEEARQLAKANKDPKAMVAASMGKAKVNGLLVDRKEHTGADGGPIQFDNLTDAQLNAQMVALLAEIGITGEAVAPFLITPLPGDDDETRH